MVKVVFAHGWGFDKSIWHKTINKLNIDRPILLDFGYTGARQHLSLQNCNKVIGVGHSMGFMWLLKNLKNPVSLISISGFDCFYSIYNKEVIKNMRRNIRKNTGTQMKYFHRIAGAPYFSKNFFDSVALDEGLKNLGEWNLQEKLLKSQIPIFSLASSDDKIIPIEHSKRVFRNRGLNIISGCGHVPPLSDNVSYYRFLERALNVSGT
jgi:pimeloyl-[acyl-carrier protein] methyl ester esterase